MILETKEYQNHGHALPSSCRGKKSLLTLYIIRYSIIQVILILLPKTAYNRHSFLAKMIEIHPQSTQTIILFIPAHLPLGGGSFFRIFCVLLFFSSEGALDALPQTFYDSTCESFQVYPEYQLP